MQVEDQMTEQSSAGNGVPSEKAAQPAEARSAVAWISGHDAVNMERASEEDFAEEMSALMERFPALTFPKSFKVQLPSSIVRWSTFRMIWFSGSEMGKKGIHQLKPNPHSRNY